MTDDDALARGPVRAHDTRDPRAPARLDDALDRLGLRTPLARDGLLAAVVLPVSGAMLWAFVVLLAEEDGVRLPPGAVALLAAAVSVQSLVLCVRRSRPVLCLATVVLVHLVILSLVPPDSSMQGLAPFIAAYTCGTLLPPHRLLRVLAAAAALIGVPGALVAGTLLDALAAPGAAPVSQPWSLVGNGILVGGLLIAALFSYAVPALVGAHVATRRRYADLTRLRAAEDVQRQRERAEGAIMAERARMARELHDIAAHHLSGMVVQLGAAELLIGRDDNAAREATAWVRSQGRETLDNLRLVVGALREPGEAADPSGGGGTLPGASGAPVPGAAALDRLVGAEQALGGSVALEREGEPYGLPPVADVTVYRVAQEALSNAREHAPNTPVRVLLHYRDSRIVLRVENETGDGRPAASGKPAGAPRGLGLLGMRERAQLVGAELAAGPTAEGGWRVRLDLPVGNETAPARTKAAGQEEA
ncbi:signal transduction histidine kinase [Murinocardiopsis flavida]|uniref:histidine kinase n=1 Tax=Murinocardiopsis flavida TaxID=645275 RepID=A0A2P8DTN5_9ACTN|nr:sensor histidine kinase [Murinocardiopsis flavida]PSL00571.1 signal transduction histidine kinase [Murinocardiopsis flavida]